MCQLVHNQAHLNAQILCDVVLWPNWQFLPEVHMVCRFRYFWESDGQLFWRFVIPNGVEVSGVVVMLWLPLNPPALAPPPCPS